MALAINIITAEKGVKELRRDTLLCEPLRPLVLCGKKKIIIKTTSHEIL
jgi:hypothetical protein